jgi:CAAX protease family protein
VIEPPTADAAGEAAGPGPGGLPAVPFRWWEALLVYLLGNLFLGGLAYALVGAREGAAPERIVVGAVVLDLVFLGSMLLWLRTVHSTAIRAIGLRWRMRTALLGVAAGLGLYLLTAVILGEILQRIYTRSVGHPVEAPDQMPGGLHGPGLVLFVILAVVIAPIVEEFYFRGILYRSLRDPYGVAAGIVGSALLFGLVHYQPGPLADAVLLQSVMVVTGVGLAVIYERAGNLVANIAAHMAFNVVGVTLILRARG